MTKIINFIPPSSSPLQEKFINYLMRQGKKTVARRIWQDTLEILRKEGNKHPEKIFEKAIENAKPVMEVRPKRIGGGVYQIPLEVKPKRRIMLAFRWILETAAKNKGKPMAAKLAKEILEASNNTGVVIKKKEDTHKMAQANKAFAHFARY